MKELFNFKGTITGGEFAGQYFVTIIAGWILAVGLMNAIPVLAGVVFITMLWAVLSLMNKRLNALHPDNKAVAWCVLVATMATPVAFISFIYLIAKNAKK